MKYYVNLSFIILCITMLCFSSCRTANTSAKEESATLSTETTQSSVASDFSFASLMRSLSLRADSIVLWLWDGETVPMATLSEDCRQSLSADSNFCSYDGFSTIQCVDNPLTCARPSVRGRTVGKVLIGGVRMDSHSAQESSHAVLARDSLSAREVCEVSHSESKESKPPNLWKLTVELFLAYMLIGLLITFIVLAVRSAFKSR